MNFTKTKNDLFIKYGISPEKVLIKGSCPEKDKEGILYYLLLAYELSRKNYKKGNLTSSSYAAGLVLDDNSVYFGVNYNATRNEISSVCAERMSILSAFKAKVEEYKEGEKFDYKIKYVLMSSYISDEVFWINKFAPCADCLSWFNTGENLSNETKICFLNKDESGKFYLTVKDLNNFLPLRNLSYTTNKIETNKIIKSKNASLTKVSDENIIKLYSAAYLAFQNNPHSKTSNQNIAASALINGEIFTGVKIDFSKRWFTEPLLMACYKGIEKFGKNATVEALCVVGEEYTTTESGARAHDGIISLKTLGRINTKFAKDNCLVITSTKEGITVYTISDYMPNEHKFIHKYEIV